MAKFTFNDLMTKISNIFKSDLYIINNKYCIGGADSEDKNITQILCLLNQESSNLVKEQFPDTDIIYIKDVKKIKENFDENIELKIFESEKNDLLNKRDKIMKLVLNIDSWKSFEFTESDITDIFTDGKTFEMFTEDSNIPNLTISKTLFPMVKEKTVNQLFYQIFIPDNEYELIQLVTSFDTEWFQIYNLIQYIKTE